MVAHGIFGEARGLRARQPILGLALELGVADEDRQHHLAAVEDIFRGYLRRLFLPDQLAKSAQPLGQCSAQPGFVRAACGGGNGVAIPAIAAVRPQRPGDCPFGASLFVGELLPPHERFGSGALACADLFFQMVGESARKLEHRLCGRVVANQFGRAFPADFDPGEKIGLRPRHAIEPLRLEPAMFAEDRGIGHEGHAGTAAVRRRPQFLERAQGQALRKRLSIQLLGACNFDDGFDR